LGLSKSTEIHIFLELSQKARDAGLKLELVTYGIAFRLNNTIVMNQALFKYPEYCYSVFDHELRHSGKFDTKDLMMDIGEGSLLKNLSFAIRNPSAFTQFLPISLYKGKILVDVNLMIVYIIAIGSVSLYLWVA
jgi:hypothetical protein